MSRVKCVVGSVNCSVFWVQCAVRSVQCVVCSVQCEASSAQFAVCCVKCEVCSVQCTVYSMQCEVCIVQCEVISLAIWQYGTKFQGGTDTKHELFLHRKHMSHIECPLKTLLVFNVLMIIYVVKSLSENSQYWRILKSKNINLPWCIRSGKQKPLFEETYLIEVYFS